MRENVDQNNSEYGQFLRSVVLALQQFYFCIMKSLLKKGRLCQINFNIIYCAQLPLQIIAALNDKILFSLFFKKSP